MTVFDLEEKKQRIVQLEILVQEPDFWQGKNPAEISEKLANLKEEVSFWQKLEVDLKDLKELENLGGSEINKEIDEQLEHLKKKFAEKEIEVFLSGKYDKGNIIMTISAGAGGVDAQDWAEMLLRMYLKYTEKHKLKTKILQVSSGQEAGIKNATLEIKGLFAYGYLKGEAGVHRLVRLSPFNTDNLRHTSFALVEVLPEFNQISEVKIRPEDLKIDTYKASGPGGQYVNKTESAIRLTHIPTGITAACQSERLQGSNKKTALKLLQLKLVKHKLESQEKQKDKFKGGQKAEWGNQIRSYVLHPYKMVKDVRTKVETSHIEEVLDGSLDEFIEAEIRRNKS